MVSVSDESALPDSASKNSELVAMSSEIQIGLASSGMSGKEPKPVTAGTLL